MDNIDLDGYVNPEQKVKINRKERRAQIKHFLKEFNDHVSRKPKIDIALENEKKQQDQIFKMQGWATRYGLLIKKLSELGYEFKEHSEGLHKQSVEQGRSAERELKDTGAVQVGDMQLMPNPKQDDNDVSEE